MALNIKCDIAFFRAPVYLKNGQTNITPIQEMARATKLVYTCKTTAKENDRNPRWDETFSTPPLNLVITQMVLRVWDHDMLSSDDFLGL